MSNNALSIFDAAVAAELPRVSHVEYDSHEICKHFAGELRKRVEQSMGITDGKAHESPSAPPEKATPAAGGVTAPGVSPTDKPEAVLPLCAFGSPEFALRLAGIRARHRNARPKPAVNQAWANSHHDIGELLRLFDAMATARDSLSSQLAGALEAAEQCIGELSPTQARVECMHIVQAALSAAKALLPKEPLP